MYEEESASFGQPADVAPGVLASEMSSEWEVAKDQLLTGKPRGGTFHGLKELNVDE